MDYLNTARNPYKMCPAYILPHWVAFKAKVQSYLNSGSTPATPTPAKQLYRVRKTWADAKSQIGAYSSLENAKKELGIKGKRIGESWYWKLDEIVKS